MGQGSAHSLSKRRAPWGPACVGVGTPKAGSGPHSTALPEALHSLPRGRTEAGGGVNTQRPGLSTLPGSHLAQEAASRHQVPLLTQQWAQGSPPGPGWASG